MNSNVKVFVPNLPTRIDRKNHLISQFKDKKEFELNIICPQKNEVGAKSLWLTLSDIIQENIKQDNSYFIFCEDDVIFTKDYSRDKLFEMIQLGVSIQADILLGGINWFQTGVCVVSDLFWVETFTGLQFSIIYRSLYQKILDSQFGEGDAADLKISKICDHKFVMHPFIAIQKDFGYSDVTSRNNIDGRQHKLFSATSDMIGILKHVEKSYSQLP